MSTVIFYTQAYNAEYTIKRAINSVLNQSRSDFIYYICDNGSTDKTWEILQGYAQGDNRIRLLQNYKNTALTGFDGWSNIKFVKHIINEYDLNSSFCSLDSDDEYKPDYLEKMLEFMEKNNLDVAACGNDYVDVSTNQITACRKLNADLILDNQSSYDYFFAYYHQFMRTIWGKLYRLSLLKQCDYENYEKLNDVGYGVDTLFCMRAFQRAKRAGILSTTLHKYYISHKTHSYKYNSKRISSDGILDDETRRLLLSKCGEISPLNEQFLNVIYFNAIKDTLNVLLGAQISVIEKLIALCDIFKSENTKRLIAYPGCVDEKKQLFKTVDDWMLDQNEIRKPEGAKIASQIFLEIHKNLLQYITAEGLTYIIIKMPDMVEPILQKNDEYIIKRLRSWYKRHDNDDVALTQLEISTYYALNKPHDEIFDLLTIIKKKRPNAAAALDIDKQIGKLFAKHPILENVSARLACNFYRAIQRMLKSDFHRALEEFISASQNAEIDDGDCEAYILLGINLSAVAENTDAYIYFKKMWVSHLLDSKRLGEAAKELDEFEQILPGDEDFAMLRERMIGLT